MAFARSSRSFPPVLIARAIVRKRQLQAVGDQLGPAAGAARGAGADEQQVARHARAAVDAGRRLGLPQRPAVLRRDAENAAVEQADALLQRAATHADAIAEAVHQRNTEITTAGFAPQVDEVPNLAHVFLNEHGTKRRLTLKEATALELTGDQWLSSTVLVRPALERTLFPTAVYMGGPGETAYFAQVTAVADALEIPRPLVVPRWSTTIIEPRVRKMLDELGVDRESIADPHAVEGQLAMR